MDSFQIIGNVFTQSSTITAISNYSLAFSNQALSYATIVNHQATIIGHQLSEMNDQITEYATSMKPVIQSYILSVLAAMAQASEEIQAAKRTAITTLTPYVNTFFDTLHETSLRAHINAVLFLERNPDTLAIVLSTIIATSILFALATPEAKREEKNHSLPHIKAE